MGFCSAIVVVLIFKLVTFNSFFFFVLFVFLNSPAFFLVLLNKMYIFSVFSYYLFTLMLTINFSRYVSLHLSSANTSNSKWGCHNLVAFMFLVERKISPEVKRLNAAICQVYSPSSAPYEDH